MKLGIGLRWYSFWIGAHYSPYHKRLCMNFLPFITIWLTFPDGNPPEGFRYIDLEEVGGRLMAWFKGVLIKELHT